MDGGEPRESLREPTTAELLRDAFRWFADGVEVRSAETGGPELSPGAAMTMSYLDDEPIRPSALARRMQVSRQRIHVVARELVAADMIRVEPDPNSGRDKLIRITPAGRRRRRRVIAALCHLDQHVAGALGEHELARLRELLLQVAAISRTQP